MLAAGLGCLPQGVAGVAGVGGPVVQVGPGVRGPVAQLAPLLVGGPVTQLVGHLDSIFRGLVVVLSSLWRTDRSNTFRRHAGVQVVPGRLSYNCLVRESNRKIYPMLFELNNIYNPFLIESNNIYYLCN